MKERWDWGSVDGPMSGYRYGAFGLTIESGESISALQPSALAFAGPADVEILEGAVRIPENPQIIDGVEVSVEGDNYYLCVPGCALFQVVGGRKIVVQVDPRSTRDEAHLYLLGSVFGVLMHQRGILPFHCNAVEIDGSAFLFCGDSGAGKSTLAAYFVQRGYRLLSDDLCALRFDGDGRLRVSGGVERLRLWQDTLEHFGRSSAELALVPGYDQKFDLPLNKRKTAEPLPVVAMYHLRQAYLEREAGIFRLQGLDAANSVTANIYRRRHADLIGAAPFYLSTAARIVDRVRIFAMNRNWGFANFRQEARAVEEHMRKMVEEMASTRV
jgi:hypothetical protein